MTLHNKTAIITGAAAGIGTASPALFAREGAKIVTVDIDRRLLDQISTLMERFGTSDEIARAALYLVSPSAEFITGVAFAIDGGLSI